MLLAVPTPQPLLGVTVKLPDVALFAKLMLTELPLSEMVAPFPL